MKIAILGTRGIPNRYGGFEQFAQHLSKGLVALGAEVWVYNSHNHPYHEESWNGVHIIHCYDPEYAIGASGQFIYDLNCIRDSRKRNFDIILQLGYTTSTMWHSYLPKNSIVVTNMDGMEWSRSKYSKPLQQFIRYAEKLAVRSSKLLIADSEVIKEYLDSTYGVTSEYIPYGATIFTNPKAERLKEFYIEANQYFMLIARMQPDNHVEDIVKGVIKSGSNFPLLVVGDINNRYGKYLKKKYSGSNIRFLGGLFDAETLNLLRYYSACYFHGHSAGGTNPSLLEAMAASAFICAHMNPFNISVLQSNALYFNNYTEIADAISRGLYLKNRDTFIESNLKRIEENYCWDNIINAYFKCFNRILTSVPGAK
jgi:glycosyltransferase involved in cell wall biosynthesis